MQKASPYAMGLLHVLCRYFSDVNKFPNMLVHTAYQAFSNNNIIRAVEMHMRMHQVVNYGKVVCVCDACCSHSSFRTFQHSHDGRRQGHSCIRRKPVNALRLHFPKYYARGNIYDCQDCSNVGAARRNEINIIIFMAHFHCVAQISRTISTIFTDFSTSHQQIPLTLYANISLWNYY